MIIKNKCLKCRGVFIMDFKNVQKIFMVTNVLRDISFSVLSVTKK